ncbi:hypothetical protein IQ277_14795 [Nostocales cyanobacterium LEGE 12452]|nr:hypothetical protein [Nostocales cyanobacterium LEGE 12452]
MPPYTDAYQQQDDERADRRQHWSSDEGIDKHKSRNKGKVSDWLGT